MNKFKNRDTQYPNRKGLIIQNIEYEDNGEISKLLVDVEREEGEVYQEGTPLNAENLNTIIQEMIEEDRNNTLTHQVKKMIEEDRNNTLAHQVKEMIEEEKNKTLQFLCTPAQKIKLDQSKIEVPTTAFFDFQLPQQGYFGTTFLWSVVSGTGITIQNGVALVNRTGVDQSVVLKLTLTNEEVSENITFTIRVPKRVYAIDYEDISLTFHIFPDGSSASIDSQTIEIAENSGILLRNEYSDIFNVNVDIYENNLLNITVSCFEFPVDCGISTFDFTVKVGNQETGQYTKLIRCNVEIIGSIYPED
ncbi:MAG: hypothetical protein NC182_04860 [Prevotella sp.]|nr:hypothetical protein [Staphylococcus sp.]MCM1350514.1 hypothetical protein [Prevotella sp.]